MSEIIKPKILAPAGDFVSLNAAIKAGCDEVYFGISGFNMRANAKNFSIKDLKKIVHICHKNNVKALLALNTIIYENELLSVKKILLSAKNSGIDAIIAWDMSVVDLCIDLGIKVHLSTQVSISNYNSLKFYAKKIPNLERVVLARECSLEDINQIIKKLKKDNLNIEIETFIHGAMCVSISGRCFMSHEIFGKSANRGECLQPCRRKFDVKLIDPEENHELHLGQDFIMSPKDLCTLDFIEKILETKIHALKIEGRNKGPEYVFTVVNSYRRVVDFYFNNYSKFNSKNNNIKNQIINEFFELKKVLKKDLEKVYNRGFSTGFYLGKPINEWTKEYGNSATHKKEYVGRVTNFFKKVSVAEILVESYPISDMDELQFQGPTTGIIKSNAKIFIDDKPTMSAKKGDVIHVKVEGVVRKNDQVYRITKR